MKMFLSHAGADAAEARRLAEDLRVQFVHTNPVIFCTSKPEDRLHLDPDRFLFMGHVEKWAKAERAAAEEIREYLRENMVSSQIYLLLVTPRSLKESRPWVRWEMFEAQAMAKERGLKFIPCLLGVPASALRSAVMAHRKSAYEEMEVGAIPDAALHPDEFQAVDVSSPSGLRELVRAAETC